MMKAQVQKGEIERLEQLRRYPILDIEPEEIFDRFAWLAASICEAPVALLTVIEADRLWYKSKVGLKSTENIREDNFCSWAIRERELFIITDASRDARFRESPLVKASPGFRFYAGVPLISSEDQTLGVLCLIDRRPRTLNRAQEKALRTIGAGIAAQLEVARKSAELRQARTECQRAIESLAASEQRYALVARSANDGLWEWNLETNQMSFCPRWKAMLGYEEHEISSRTDEWFRRIHPEDVELVQEEIMSHLLGLTPHFQKEHRMLTREGGYRWMMSRGAAIWDSNRQIYRMAGSLTDITDQKEAEKRLLHNAFHDALTGLPNRSLFMERLKRSLECSKHRDDYLFAVLFLDLDRFKVVNDNFGHQIGDQLLVTAARRIQATLRPEDMIARLGGDEFAILLDHLKQVSDATQAAERIQRELSLPFNLSGYEVSVSGSIGIAFNLIPYDQPEDILRSADTAMYRAKDQGRNCFELFDNGMYVPGVALVQLENDLRRALNRNEFRIHYQPIISVGNWQITGFEALIRWQHPEKGLVSPVEFVRVAEETDLIIPIGQLVLREACKQLRRWQDEFPADPPLSVSVNLSGRQFSQPGLIEHINQVLIDTGLKPSCLKVEITESAIIENIDAATAILRQLRALGIKICLDDFGTGYSSLSYLHRFPIDTLKIDRSFVTRMNLPKNTEIVRTIINLANNLGMDVIAEGVETGEQVIQLSGLDCEHVQGYLLSKPLDGRAMGELLRDTYNRGLAWQLGPSSAALDLHRCNSPF